MFRKKKKSDNKSYLNSKMKYHNLVEHSLVGMYIIQDNKFLFVNKRFCDIFGYSYEEIVGKIGPVELAYEEDKHIVAANIRKRIVDKMEYIQYELRAQKKDKNLVWVKVLGCLTEIDNKPAISGTIVDISHNKKTEDELRKNEGRLRTLLNTIPDLVWLKDAEGNYMQCNPRFESFYGTPEKNIIGKSDYDFVPEEQADFFRENDKKAAASKKPIMNEEMVTFADGHKEILETIKTPVYGKDGEFIGVLGIGRDITSRKNAEADLIKKQILLRDSQRVANLGCWELDMKTGDLYWNEETYVIYGIADFAVKPSLKTFSQLVHPDDQYIFVKHFESIISTKSFPDYECRIVRVNDNAVRDILIAGDIELDKAGEIVRTFGIIQDITERKKMLEDLRKYQRHLEDLVKERTNELDASNAELKITNQKLLTQKEELQTALDKLKETQNHLIHAEKMASLGVLSAGIAHEINNPLNFIQGGIFGFKNFLKEHLKDDFESAKPFIDTISTGAQRASEIVKSLSHYSRQGDVKRINCNIHTIIENCLVILNSQLKGRVTVEKQYTAKTFILEANDSELHQAMLNILTNAVQAVGNKGTITIKTDVIKDELIIFVSDTGTGIRPEIAGKVFDPFFTTKAPGKGTGLGLSITYNIIQEHNGSIEFDETYSTGARMIIRLPVKLGPDSGQCR